MYKIDYQNIQMPWMNFLTAQSIPEETDSLDYPKRQHTDSGCSSSSSEDSYVVLEVQRPRSIFTEQELNFEDVHYVEYDQLTQSLIIETPSKENAIECSSDDKEYPTVTQISTEPPRSFHLSKPEKSPRTFTHPPAMNIEKPSSIPSFDSANKSSSILRLVKKHTRNVKSEYCCLSNEMQTNEPSLLQLKYLDGRPALIDLNALESFEKSRLSSTQDSSNRNRLFNRLQTFLKSDSTKSIFEFMNKRKSKRTDF